MKKFILIDHSIKNAGGHHLEYALRVLKAAKKLGFQTVLGTNKKCEEVISDHIDVVDKAFSHTFWENFQSEFIARGTKERQFLNKIKTKKDQLLYDLMCSSLGFSYMAAAQGLSLPDLFRRYGSAISGRQLSKGMILAGYFLTRLNGLRDRFKKKFHRFTAVASFSTRWTLKALAGVSGILLAPIFLPYVLIYLRRVLGRPDIHAAQFADDMRHLLVRVNAANGDIIFVPTLGNLELIGSAICAEHFPFKDISWHFLFRRSIFQGREPSYQAQIEKQIETVQAFSAYKLRTSGRCANFYTDTNALTEQYNRLGVFKFRTLPIPLDEALERSRDPNKHRVNITYIGDARDEKGFPLLTRLVGDLRAAGYLEDKVRFTFQSNFNVPGGEPGSRIAKAQLAVEVCEQVNLVEGPLESEQYTALINEADILLVPYDADNYYARSSGIFAEALAAGIPVVATDKSWMSQEMLILNQNYYRELLETKRILQSISLNNAEAHSKLLVYPRSSEDFAWMLVEVKQLFERPGCYLHVNWRSSPDTILKVEKNASFFRQFTIDLRAATTFGLLLLPKKDRILLKFQVDNGLGHVLPISKSGVFGISITVHELDMAATEPLFQACALYSVETDLSNAVIEVIEKYDKYLAQCQQFRKTWKSFHDAEVLVNMLEGVGK